MKKQTHLTCAMCAAIAVPLSNLHAVSTPDDPVPGDANLDGVVNAADQTRVLLNFGKTQALFIDGDMNRDYTVDVADFDIVAMNTGHTQAPLPSAPGVNLTDSLGGALVDGVITTLGDVYDSGAAGGPLRVFRDEPLVNLTNFAPAGVAALTPTIEATWLADGVDLEVTYTNTGSVAMYPGALYLPLLTRVGDMRWRDMTKGGALFQIAYNQFGNWSGPLRSYPGPMYAPVAVFEDHTQGYAVGVSVQYPALEYEHAVALMSTDVNNRGPYVRFFVNAEGNGANYDPANNIQPGETRTFDLSIRVRQVDFLTAHAGEWMHTLRPYRRWFRGLYGGVQYTRRAEQVKAAFIAANSETSAANPYGFRQSATHRPDLYGFGPLRSDFDSYASEGWERILLGTPTGVYRFNVQNNFPPQFTSEWPTILSTVLAGYDNTTTPLSTYAASSGGTLGLWWGRAAQIADVWDDPILETYDPSIPSHRAFRANELSGALSVNAEEIGLDAFTVQGQWQGYWTLVDNRDLFPSFRFITESIHSDLVHTLAPTFTLATQDPGSPTGELYKFPQGVPIMDFLVPGHELWGKTTVADIKIKLGLPTSANVPAEDTRSFIQDVADLGFVPVFYGAAAVEDPLDSTEFDAAETWLITVPPALR